MLLLEFNDGPEVLRRQIREGGQWHAGRRHEEGVHIFLDFHLFTNLSEDLNS